MLSTIFKQIFADNDSFATTKVLVDTVFNCVKTI